MGGGGLGSILESAIQIGTLGISDMLGITGGGMAAPMTAAPTDMKNQTGNVMGEGGGKTLDLTEQDKQRGSISKKRLGTKQLQIPLANQAAAGVNVAPTQGVNV